MIGSAAGAASLDLQGSLAVPVVHQPSRREWAPLQIRGGCASSRLDHGLKVWLCSKKSTIGSQSWFADHPSPISKRPPSFSQYLAVLEAKHYENKYQKSLIFYLLGPFGAGYPSTKKHLPSLQAPVPWPRPGACKEG